jgi:hypothetical protein
MQAVCQKVTTNVVDKSCGFCVFVMVGGESSGKNGCDDDDDGWKNGLACIVKSVDHLFAICVCQHVGNVGHACCGCKGAWYVCVCLL